MQVDGISWFLLLRKNLPKHGSIHRKIVTLSAKWWLVYHLFVNIFEN